MPQTRLVTGDLTVLIAEGGIERFEIIRKIHRRPDKERRKVLIAIERPDAVLRPRSKQPAPAQEGSNPMTRALQAIRRQAGKTDPADPALKALQQALASPEDLYLFIEEPELHLDPARQRAITRILTQAVHYGAKVFLTTQSDWVMRELNNVIMTGEMLDAKGPELAKNRKVLRKHSYREDQAIRHKQVKAYALQGQGLKACSIDEFGVDARTMDQTIEAINDAVDDFISRIGEEK